MTATRPELLQFLYPERWREVDARLDELVARHRAAVDGRTVPALDARTAYLITYGDSIRRPGEQPLRTLAATLDRLVGDAVTDVHLLPMFPWTSDDGFAVVDHRQVNPELGTWADVADLGRRYRLMFDFVANHVSSSSPWFTGWLAGDPEHAGFFLRPADVPDTSQVVRPRTTPLFHAFDTPSGDQVEAWTTFGRDQVDVNPATPEVLVELTDVLLGYLARGASTIRLDAIGYLWKESGTTCIHLPQTHAVIKLWRLLADAVAAGTRLITETNVPHADNVQYLGDGSDEATMVYQFPLPPLVLHSFVSGSTRELSAWASGIGPVGDRATYFNFLASHDGIGMRPATGLLSADQQQALVERVLACGGRASMATGPDGRESVYELNLSYLDALCAPDELADETLVAAKAVAAHAILLAMVGVPAVFVHSLFGSRSDAAAVERTGINRRINRAQLDADGLEAGLRDDPRRRLVFGGITRLLRVRAAQPALSPFSPQQVEHLDDRVFAVRRGEGATALLCVTNVTGDQVALPGVRGLDVLGDSTRQDVTLGGYESVWLGQ